jgi:hypothetical protein
MIGHEWSKGPGGPASSEISHQWNHSLAAAAGEPFWASEAKSRFSLEFAWLLAVFGKLTISIRSSVMGI